MAGGLRGQVPSNLRICWQSLATLGLGQVAGRGADRDKPICARAVSASYYALFHTLARCVADELVGRTLAHRSQPAWRQVYRSLEHGFARSQCNRPELTRFPQAIQEFGQLFVNCSGIDIRRITIPRRIFPAPKCCNLPMKLKKGFGYSTEHRVRTERHSLSTCF